jgi:nucleoside-triphosphatase THEP1
MAIQKQPLRNIRCVPKAGAKDIGNFEADKSVGAVLRKMFTAALEVPPEGVMVDEKIFVPDDLPPETARSALLGNVVTSVIERKSSRQKVFFPLDTLTRHAIITGSSGEGKTYFAMHLALEAASRGIECLLIDPHGHFQLLPKRDNIRREYVSSSEQIAAVLKQVYQEAFTQTIMPGEARLRKLVIIDEISAHKFNMKRILPILNSCFSELRKFGYGFVIICTYATDQRGISPTVRENSETYFVFRKKTLNELERIATLAGIFA